MWGSVLLWHVCVFYTKKEPLLRVINLPGVSDYSHFNLNTIYSILHYVYLTFSLTKYLQDFFHSVTLYIDQLKSWWQNHTWMGNTFTCLLPLVTQYHLEITNREQSPEPPTTWLQSCFYSYLKRVRSFQK